MERNQVMALIANTFIKGAATSVIVKKSADSSMNKGRGANKNPFWGRVEVEKVYNGFVLGTDYSNSLANTAKRMGNEDAEVKLKENWHVPTFLFGEWFSTDKKTETKVYLKLQHNEKQVACKTTTTYYVDNRLATDEEVEEIKMWLKKKCETQSSTQTEMGIDREHEQHFLLPQLETITDIIQGERVIRPMSLISEEVEVPVMVYA